MLPPSVPKGWPNSSAEALRKNPQRKVYLNPRGQQQNSFCGNAIKTSRYEIWNFLPMFLLEEFNPKVKIANCYFLVISGLQCIRAISNTGGYPTVLIPLSVVLLISGIFKAAEDIARHKADNQANCSKTEVFNRETKEFEAAYWSEIVVGDYVRIAARETVPADILIVQVAPSTDNSSFQEEVSACYVETKSLDGETNLKQRNVLPALMGVQGINFPSDLFGVIEMEHPNQLIDSFSGVIELELPDAEMEQRETFRRSPSPELKTKTVRAAIQPNNVILRGCILRNTTWMVGLVLNTGKDVKIMQGSASSISASKFSNLEQLAARQIFGVMILLIAMCFTGATAQAIFNSNYNVSEAWYLNWAPSGVVEWIIQFFYLLLLHASFIPVSLYVSMAIVRFGQAYFMNRDLDMYYERLGYPASVRSMMLNEELGQISYVFSDKTGTLTCNDMVFRKMSINGISYGQGITEIGKAAWKLMDKPVPPDVLIAEEEAIRNAVAHVAFYDPLLQRDLAATDTTPYRKVDEEKPNAHSPKGSPNPFSPKGSPRLSSRQKILSKVILTAADQSNRIKTFCRFLSICHEAVPENLEDGSVKISAPNPDDEALVCAAAYFGYEFKDRKKNVIYVFEKDTQSMLEIEVLFLIPFTSGRKRMSVIIRDIDGKIKIITKGADSALLHRLDPTCDEELTRATLGDVERYSLEGLRCLMLASAEVSDEKFRTWRRRYEKATTDLFEIEKKKNGELNDIDTFEDFIENELFIVGATAIEDRLQEGVPECIERLIDGGMKVWVLTGDKEGTAINIAVACNLLLPTQYMHHIVINKNTAPTKRHVFAMLTKEIMRMRRESSSREETVNVSKMPAGFWEELASDPAVFPRALIIDGPSLLDVMADTDTQFVLLKFSSLCKAVVCCRMSPEQKREIVQMVKNGIPGVRTLSVGDGANDVAMIKAAHVGVGIKGEEGVQAVNASDFAIAQFRFLSSLLLKHGRYNYCRMSNLICFMFYKNILMSSAMFFFNFFNGFSGYKFYTEGAIQFFNLFYTSVPVLLYGVYDQDIFPATAMAHPQTYVIGLRNQLYNTATFWQWVGNAIFEAAVFSILPLFLLTNMDSIRSANLESSLQVGTICFTAVVIVANYKLLLIQSRWHLLHVVLVLLSIGSWVGLAFVVNYIYLVDFDFYHLWWRILHSGTFWLSLLFIVASIALKDVLLSVIKRYYFPHPHQLLQELEASPSYTTPSDDYISSNKYRKIENRSGPLPIYLVSRAERKRRIVERRGVFKWMPVFFENDEVHGAWYFIAGSALSALIPCIPLFGLFMPLLEVVDILPLVDHVAAYGLLIFIGVLYTIGSFAYLRASSEPKMPPLFTWRHFATDKLFAFWLFAIGTAPSIPVMIIYVAHNPSNKPFQLALAVSILVTIAMVLLTFYCYPNPDGSLKKPKDFFANLLCVFMCRNSCYGRHLANDWLLGCWLLFIGTLLGCVCGAILLAYSAYHGMAREIYDWSTGLFDLVLFLIGTMYVLAGAYEEESGQSADHDKWMAGSVRVLSDEDDDAEQGGELENSNPRDVWNINTRENENHGV